MLSNTIFESNEAMKKAMDDNEIANRNRVIEEKNNARINCKNYIHALSSAISGKKIGVYVRGSINMENCPELNDVASKMKKFGIKFDGKTNYNGTDLCSSYGKIYEVNEKNLRYMHKKDETF